MPSAVAGQGDVVGGGASADAIDVQERASSCELVICHPAGGASRLMRVSMSLLHRTDINDSLVQLQLPLLAKSKGALRWADLFLPVVPRR